MVLPTLRSHMLPLLLTAGLSQGFEPASGPQETAEYIPSGAPIGESQRVALNTRWELGYYLFQIQEYAAAAHEFEKIRDAFPADASLLALIGSCYSLSGQWPRAEAALLAAKAHNPEDGEIDGLIGQFYVAAGQVLKGAAYLEQALKAEPEQDDIRARLAYLYLDAGWAQRARFHLENLLRIREAEGAPGLDDPGLDHAYARSLLATGEPEASLKYAARAYRAAPGEPAYARMLGLALMANRRYGEAARMLSRGRQASGGGEGLYLQWGEALFLDRQWERAEAIWLEGVGRFPASYVLLGRLVDFYVAVARPEKAARMLRFAESRHPGHAGNLLLEARLKRKLGDYAAAAKTVERLRRMACGSMVPEALWEQAQLDFANRRFASCEKTLDRLLQGKTRRAEAHLLKARLALFRGEKTAAGLHLRQARMEGPVPPRLASRVPLSGTGADAGLGAETGTMVGTEPDAEPGLAGIPALP